MTAMPRRFVVGKALGHTAHEGAVTAVYDRNEYISDKRAARIGGQPDAGHSNRLCGRVRVA